ncbi:MAG TPA: YceH family protein [Acidimicrobiales bacterium]|nr:YceH family protein [Acidimicrobiales bacterium]
MAVPRLSAPECRVLGSLIEKELTTPQQYPLTLNALTLACNQTTNRDPVADYDDAGVEAAVTSLKERGLARFVHPSHGRSALRFRHAADEALGLEVPQRALVGVLLLRGPQTPGELRSRTERMAAFDDVHAAETVLEELASRGEPLVVRLERLPGQKESRYAHLLGDAAAPAAPAPAATVAGAEPLVSGDGPGRTGEGVASVPAPAGDAAVRDELSRLRAEVDGLRRDLDALRRELGA